MKLEDYLLGAKKIMTAQRRGYLTKDNDAIGEVASRMIWADHTWDGRSKRDTWRYNQASFAIQKIVKKQQNQKQKNIISLSKNISRKDDDMTLGDVLEDKRDDITQQYNEICYTASKVLNGVTLNCFNMYYKDNMTMQEIGDTLGFSKENTRLHLNKAIKRIKECM